MTKTYSVVYRLGGTENFSWHRSLAYPTRELAEQGAVAVRLGGRRAFVVETRLSESIGLPDTFDADIRTTTAHYIGQ